MSTKQELASDLRAVYNDWERLLSTAADKQLVSRRVTSKWTLQDLVAHLMAWQQISIARLEAAMAGRGPVLPAWLGGADPFHANDNVDEFNAKIYAIHKARPWPDVHRAWREGFARLLELAETIPEETLFDANRFSWLRGGALSDVLAGSCEHHREHLDAALRTLGD